MSYKLQLERNRTWDKTATYRTDGAAANLTGKTLVFRLRKETAKDVYLITLSTDAAAANANGSRLSWVNQAGGEFRLILTDEETAALTITEGKYSFSLEYGGAKFPAGGGSVVVKTL